MLGFLQKIRPHLRELAFLFGRNDRSGFVEAVGDQVVQLLPIIELQSEQPKLGFQGFVSHKGPVAESSRVSSSFCRLSMSRCAHGRSTVWTWLMIPSSK